jgi:hypothetical protein
LSKEATNDVGQSLERPKVARDDALEFVPASRDPLPHAMVLEMIPDQLVGVQLRRVRGQEDLQAHPG